MGAPVGNQNAAKGKVWADAIRKALVDADREDAPHAIRKLVLQLLTKAAEGDMAALKELGDRLDGKPAQAIVGDATHDPVQLQQIQRIIVDPTHRDAKGV